MVLAHEHPTIMTGRYVQAISPTVSFLSCHSTACQQEHKQPKSHEKPCAHFLTHQHHAKTGKDMPAVEQKYMHPKQSHATKAVRCSQSSHMHPKQSHADSCIVWHISIVQSRRQIAMQRSLTAVNFLKSHMSVD